MPSGKAGRDGVKFSIIYEAQTVLTDPDTEFRMFHDIVDQCLLAEQVGFDVIWAVEHTALPQYAHMSAPETFLAFVAGKTTRLEIGHGVVCLPPAMNHPVKVAERIATLDILSKGRLHFGMGKGATQQEAGTFGYRLEDLPPMIDESMYLIPKIMVNEYIEHEGRFIQIPRRPIFPKPYQKPHPYMYMATTKPETLKVAGERGLGALVLGFGGPDDVAQKNVIYREAFRTRTADKQVGYRPIEHLAALCPAVVLEDGDRARRVGLRGQRFFVESLGHWYNNGPPPCTDDLDASEHEAALEKMATARLSSETITTGHRYVSSSVAEDAYGTVDNCIRYVERLFEAGADEILFMLQMGTIPNDIVTTTIRNIGEKVIPHFR
jgi:alkanesulfonate monooxygenase SsuD/methylene tetrahydromethanopterin reductase-like flavin-dependent oxidoreductase (luciferase family)